MPQNLKTSTCSTICNLLVDQITPCKLVTGKPENSEGGNWLYWDAIVNCTVGVHHGIPLCRGELKDYRQTKTNLSGTKKKHRFGISSIHLLFFHSSSINLILHCIVIVMTNLYVHQTFYISLPMNVILWGCLSCHSKGRLSSFLKGLHINSQCSTG